MKSFFVLLSTLLAVPAHAVFDYTQSSREWLQDLVATGLADERDYQIGDEWGKRAVTPEMLREYGPHFARAAAATARYGGATAFYLGKINGHHMMATNHHVMPGDNCSVRRASFPVLGKVYPCKKFYGHWPAIDLAFFSISVPTEDEAVLHSIGRNFNFSSQVYAGQELITIGFGAYRNSERRLMANADRDCRVHSARGDVRYIADPDRINPADYKSWSFSTGCDVSHGDSGSAIVDRHTGEVIGIIWTTATQKPERIRSSSYVDSAMRAQHDDVWNWLSYAVPASKMRDYLEDLLSRTRFSDRDIAETIRAVLDTPGVRLRRQQE